MINKTHKKALALIVGILASLCILTLSGLGIIAKIADDDEIKEETSINLSDITTATIIDQDNNPHKFRLEIADEASEWEKGLMERDSLPKDQGMLFIYPDERTRTFWMKNTYIPLDIIFLDDDLRIVNIHKMAEPLNTEKLYISTTPSKFVLEINGGLADEYNIDRESRVILK